MKTIIRKDAFVKARDVFCALVLVISLPIGLVTMTIAAFDVLACIVISTIKYIEGR